MSQIPTIENDDNRSVAASDFVQLDQPDTSQNFASVLKEQMLMMANLEAKNQTLQKAVENLELRAENRSLKENAEQKANYQALKAEMMNELKDEFAQMLAEQQKQMMAQFEARIIPLEQKLKEAEQRMEEKGKQAIDSSQMKLDYMWSHLMVKNKVLANPKGNVWNGLTTTASISEYGLKATMSVPYPQYLFAAEGFTISGEHYREDNFPFPGNIVYYFEVTITMYISFAYPSIGFTDGNMPIPAGRVGGSPNSYGIAAYDAENYGCWLAGKEHKLVECPTGAIDAGAVVGCGICLNSKNELYVFFTLDGALLGKQMPIKPTVDCLYPTVYMYRTSVEANFGDNLVIKPFKFDIDKCPGLIFE